MKLLRFGKAKGGAPRGDDDGFLPGVEANCRALSVESRHGCDALSRMPQRFTGASGRREFPVNVVILDATPDACRGHGCRGQSGFGVRGAALVDGDIGKTVTDKQLSPLEQLKRALDAGLIDQNTYNTAIAAQAAVVKGDGAVAQAPEAVAAGAAGVGVGGDSRGDINTGVQVSNAEGGQVVYAEAGATVVMGDTPVAMPAVDRDSISGRYLQHLIAQNRYLQLQGIRSGGKLVNIELDRIYVTLRATRQRAERAEADWLAHETGLAPGELQRRGGETAPSDSTHVTVNQALAADRRLVVLGDPGSGKTTLLRYLALLYARDQAESARRVGQHLGLDESGMPIFLPLRGVGRFLAEHHPRDDGTQGHELLLRFLGQMLQGERITVPTEFFDQWLQSGRAVVLLDGLDEVADPELRRRVSRLTDAFTRAYPLCRYVVSSRIVGYTEISQLSEGYAITRIRDFTLDDINTFLTQWHRLVAIGQQGPGPAAEATAARQTGRLLDSIAQNDRVRELAINPLMLTVIALVHRDRVKLPDRRAELYQEAVEVLLGKWDDARGVQDLLVLDGRKLDISDRRLILQQVALHMHEGAIKEIETAPLRELLAEQLGAGADEREREAAVTRFLDVIQQRTGLLIARAEGAFAFSHLTFQEYLAALAIADRDDYLDYSLARAGDEWWREVILLEAGYLSTQGKDRTTRLIRALAAKKEEPEIYHNLVLAAECVRDAGANRILGGLESELRARLRRELETPAHHGSMAWVHSFLTRGMSAKAVTKHRIAAAEALGKIGGAGFWSRPHGEPDWAVVAQGEFSMGEGRSEHRVFLPAFRISRGPVSNAQYQLFVLATRQDPPGGWNGRRAPRGRESHPVVGVSWHDALAYCAWLSRAVGKPVDLPSEAEWEKAARGALDARQYPWGDTFDAARCNVYESGLEDTTPIGIYTNGASPSACLDMAGNVWEWTRSLWGRNWEEPEFGYPYDPNDRNREDPAAPDEIWRVVRGGAFDDVGHLARCAYRYRLRPDYRHYNLGFRVVLRSPPVNSELG